MIPFSLLELFLFLSFLFSLLEVSSVVYSFLCALVGWIVCFVLSCSSAQEEKKIDQPQGVTKKDKEEKQKTLLFLVVPFVCVAVSNKKKKKKKEKKTLNE
jgi:Ca2+/Na+ antiporter